MLNISSKHEVLRVSPEVNEKYWTNPVLFLLP